MDYCKYVNVFQGNGEIDLPKPEGIAARWFFIKAGTGNTSPAACLPFGAMSVAPFSGGYPSGYGDNLPNSHSRPPHFEEGKKLLGFSHLHHSGTGAIGYYYNYAVVTPRNPCSPERFDISDEYAEPGYYRATLDNIVCEVTASKNTAFHRYTFPGDDGSVTVNFDNNGLLIPGRDRHPVNDLKTENADEFTVTASALIEGVKIYFAVRADSPLEIRAKTAVACVPAGKKTANIKVSISLLSTAHALKALEDPRSFDEVRLDAHEIWNNALSHIKIDTSDERIARIFYSNLYHSLIKPCDRENESFMYSGGEFMVDFSTLWDMYKTALPLICMLYRDTAKKITDTLMNICDNLGMIPNCIGISDGYKKHSEQARILGCYVLLTAYRYGIIEDKDRMLKVIVRDIMNEDNRDFIDGGKCKSDTWTLDMADGCALAADAAEENGDIKTAQILRPLASRWERCYNAATGLLGEDSEYYEGTLYNYSFRQMADMDRRMEIAGGKENFVKLLDAFFGYGAPAVTLPCDPFNSQPVHEGMKLGRFEGFNNESDTETPFSYIYAGRHDRTCEILRAGMKYMFTEGRGGIPGNNDSGALSSYYVFAALGLFPVAGQNLFLIGSPFVKFAEITLSSGKTLEITVDNTSDSYIYVKNVKFNSVEINDFKLSADRLMSGGKLEFTMSDKK